MTLEEMGERLAFRGLAWDADCSVWRYECAPCVVSVWPVAGRWRLTLDVGGSAGGSRDVDLDEADLLAAVNLVMLAATTLGPARAEVERHRARRRDYTAALSALDRAQSDLASAVSDLRRQR